MKALAGTALVAYGMTLDSLAHGTGLYWLSLLGLPLVAWGAVLLWREE